MQTVNFINMADGTREDYEFLHQQEQPFIDSLPDRIMDALRQLDGSFGGYKVSRLEHSLQSATHAHRNNEDEEMVVAALVHDIGDTLAPLAHSELAASILRPYVSEKTYWIIKHHGIFQMYYYAHHFGNDRNARDRFKDHPHYTDTARFCEVYDQNCFDPEFDSLPLEFFEPMVKRIFTREPKFGETSEESLAQVA